MKNRFWIYLGVVFAMAFWGLSFVWYKEVYVFFNPVSTAFFRLLISSVLLAVFSLIMRKLQPVQKADILPFLLLAFFEPFLYFLGESFGVRIISSSLASIIIATIPLFAPVAGYYFYKEKLSKSNYLGILISIIGVIMVVSNDPTNGGSKIAGMMLMFLAVFGAIGYTVMVKRLSEKYNPFTIVTYQNSLGVIYFLPVFILTDFSGINLFSISIEMLIPLMKLAVFASTIAFLLFTIGVNQLGVAKATVFTNTIPVFTALFAFYVLRENMNIFKMSGIGIVIAGLFLSQAKNIGLIPKFITRYANRS
ncbi:MAG: DMT family transporter [Bacteroidales bacterium]|nr:DMT family transporter [Bacteroidales bacterium]